MMLDADPGRPRPAARLARAGVRQRPRRHAADRAVPALQRGRRSCSASAASTIARSLVGNYITSLEMAGASITLLVLDDELTALWDAPVQDGRAALGRVSRWRGDRRVDADTVTALDAGAAAAALGEQRDYLTQLDAAIGDADHGVEHEPRVRRRRAASWTGSTAARRRARCCVAAGPTLVSTVGGASGPLWGSALRGGPAGARRRRRARRPRSSSPRSTRRWPAVVELGAAEPGDKTMVDALAPARRALARARSTAGALARARRSPRPRGRRGGHARDGADAGPQGPGVVPRRALDRPPGSRRDVGGADHAPRSSGRSPRSRGRERRHSTLRGTPASPESRVGAGAATPRRAARRARHAAEDGARAVGAA